MTYKSQVTTLHEAKLVLSTKSVDSYNSLSVSESYKSFTNKYNV